MRWIVALLLALAPAGAQAQTAEETVAFIVLGIEDGTQWGDGPKAERFLQLEESPATFKVQSDVDLGTITVRTVGSCRYHFSTVGEGIPLDATVDFAKASPPVIEQVGTSVIVRQRGVACDGSGSDRMCFPDGRNHVRFTEAVRVERAYAHFNENFCKGRAF